MSLEPTSTDRFKPQRDVSRVPTQGGYMAKYCPLRVQYDEFPPADVVQVPYDEASEARMQRGRDFEAEIFEELERLHGSAVTRLDRAALADRSEREVATLAAMDRGVELILGGRLPEDEAGRRVGEPDVLARAETRPDGRWAYHPIDVKHHRALDAKEGSAVLIGSLAEPFKGAASTSENTTLRSATDNDMLQLAHYIRMLEACGHAPSDQFGGIIGAEGMVTWTDLTRPRFGRNWSKEKDSALGRYDFEFSFRLDVLAEAMVGQSSVEPMWCSECEGCPWREKCEPDLVAADSVSFLPRSTYRQWHGLRRNGLDRRAALAEVEERWVILLAELGADLAKVIEKGSTVLPEAPIMEVVGKRATKKLRVLQEAGISTAADLSQVPEWAVDVSSREVGSLRNLWRDARVSAWGQGRPHLRPGTTELVVPSADIEIDIDMENALDGGIYLWGALRDDTYFSFVSWDPDSATAEEESFRSFWSWLQPQVEAAGQGGPSVSLYCWAQNAENRALVNGARRVDAQEGTPFFEEEVTALIASDGYVDLKQVFDKQLMTASGTGLKRVAPMAGFAWRDEDPGGDQSMLRHAVAVDPSTPPSEAAANRQRLLTYNEDDVRATAAIRAWMRSKTFPRFDDLARPQVP